MSEKNEITSVNSEREKDFSFEYPQKPVTNGDRIRDVTDEILAEYLTHKKRLASMEAEKNKIMTNGDKVRAMTDEELARFLGDVDCYNPGHCKPGMYCAKCWLNWLKSPANEHGGDEK